MADLTHESLGVHLVKDAKEGYAHFVADVEGCLFPLVSVKLGWLEDRLKAFEENNVHPAVTGDVTAPSPPATADVETPPAPSVDAETMAALQTQVAELEARLEALQPATPSDTPPPQE